MTRSEEAQQREVMVASGGRFAYLTYSVILFVKNTCGKIGVLLQQRLTISFHG